MHLFDLSGESFIKVERRIDRRRFVSPCRLPGVRQQRTVEQLPEGIEKRSLPFVQHLNC